MLKAKASLVCRTLVLFFVASSISLVQAQQNFSAQTINGGVAEISILLGSMERAKFFRPDFADVHGVDGGPNIYYRYVLLKLGDKYGITINLRDKAERVQVGIAVDGRHVISGQKVGSAIELLSTWDAAAASAYVIDQREDGIPTTLQGWRENDNSVRQFVVTTQSNSLAAKWDKNNLADVGTIVVAVFRERASAPQVTLRGFGTRGLGTGAGQAVASKVTATTFSPSEVASEVFVIRYETLKTLQKLGVVVTAPLARSAPKPGKDHIEFPKR